MIGQPNVSIAVPLFNEQSVLLEFYRRTTAVLSDLPHGEHEIVFVDDGSSDDTPQLLETLAATDLRVKALLLSRNFGHQAALTAALDHVKGDVVVVMDGDLQDTPETIPRFIEKYREGFDVVYAVRQSRKEGLLLRGCYALFYRLIASLADIKLPLGAGDFALMSRRVVEELKHSRERHRYLRGLRTWVGFRQTGIPVERDARHSGKSKYGIRKLFQLAFDGIFSFSTMPVRAATVLGGLTIAGSLLFAAYSIIAKLFLDQSPAGFTALILAITFLAGVQLVFLGVIGEYVGRIYEEVKQRPHYILDRVVTHQEATEPSHSALLDDLVEPTATSASQLTPAGDTGNG